MGRVPWDGVSPRSQTWLGDSAELPRESLSVDWPVSEVMSLEKQRPGVHQGQKLVPQPGGWARGLEVDKLMGCWPAGAWP